MEQHPPKCGIPFEVEDSFGVATHYKNDCDRDFSYTRGMTTRIAKGTEVTEIGQLVRLWQSHHEMHHAKLKAPTRDMVWIHFMPKWSREEMRQWAVTFDRKSFTEPIRTSHSFVSRLKDTRRRGLLGIDGCTYTGLDFKCNMVQGHPAPSDRCREPVIKDEVSPDDAPEPAADNEAQQLADEAAEAVGGSDGALASVLLPSTVENGWQCSYRSVAPEQKKTSDFVKRISAMQNRFDAFGVKRLPGRTSIPKEEMLAKQAATKKRKREVRCGA